MGHVARMSEDVAPTKSRGIVVSTGTTAAALPECFQKRHNSGDDTGNVFGRKPSRPADVGKFQINIPVPNPPQFCPPHPSEPSHCAPPFLPEPRVKRPQDAAQPDQDGNAKMIVRRGKGKLDSLMVRRRTTEDEL